MAACSGGRGDLRGNEAGGESAAIRGDRGPGRGPGHAATDTSALVSEGLVQHAASDDTTHLSSGDVCLARQVGGAEPADEPLSHLVTCR